MKIRKLNKDCRLGLRATPQQEMLLRAAADYTQQSLTDFILENACLAAEKALLDKKLFLVDAQTGETFLELLDRPAKDNMALNTLLSTPAPWEK